MDFVWFGYPGVRVARNGTVADLKQAIEEVFDSPGASEHCKITW